NSPGDGASAQQPPQQQQAPGGAPPQGGPGGPGRGRGFGFALDDRAELERRTTAITLADVKPGDIVFGVAEPGATETTAHVKVLVKLDLPPDRTPSEPGMQGPPIPSDPGDPPQL